jgi:hypothetical protein
MGYTHYWDKKKKINKSAWDSICRDAKKAIAGSEVVQREMDNRDRPEIGENVIAFNGVEHDGHETFFLERENPDGFCKTARKPYDKYVTAVLCIAWWHAGDSINVYSDGYSDDWDAGLKIAKSVIPEIEVPSQVEDWPLSKQG